MDHCLAARPEKRELALFTGLLWTSSLISMGTIKFRVTFEDERKESFDTLQRAIFAIKDNADKMKLVGEERQLYFDATVIEQVAEQPGASHAHRVDWQKVWENTQ